MAPRSRAHLCFTMVEGSNRRREEGDVSRGFRVSRATDWQGQIGFFVASPFPIWRRTHFPSTLNSCLPGPLHCLPLFRLRRESGALFTTENTESAEFFVFGLLMQEPRCTLTGGWPIVFIPVRRQDRDSAGTRGLGREGGLRGRGGRFCPGTFRGIYGPP